MYLTFLRVLMHLYSFELKSVELLFLIHVRSHLIGIAKLLTSDWYQWEICTGLALVMATDFCIAASLCGYLFFSRKGEYTGYVLDVLRGRLASLIPLSQQNEFSDQLPLLVHDQYRSTHHVSLRAGFIERPAFTGNFVDCAAWVV